jgi:hypothetical protein
MGDLFGGGGGNKGQQVNIPAFQSSGGITPEQQSLANFSFGQDLLGQGAAFGDEGLGQSTMATQGAEGAANTQAQQEGGMSDADQEAMYQLYQNNVSAQEQQLQNATTNAAQNSAGLGSLATAAGFNSTGAFGTPGTSDLSAGLTDLGQSL